MRQLLLAVDNNVVSCC